MSIQMLTRFLMWCTLLNMGLLIVLFLVLAFAGDFVYKMHGRWFPLTRETFNAVIYSFLGGYKIIILAFNLIPWIALTIVG